MGNILPLMRLQSSFFTIFTLVPPLPPKNGCSKNPHVQTYRKFLLRNRMSSHLVSSEKNELCMMESFTKRKKNIEFSLLTSYKHTKRKTEEDDDEE